MTGQFNQKKQKINPESDAQVSILTSQNPIEESSETLRSSSFYLVVFI